jgi:hypothetical protein
MGRKRTISILSVFLSLLAASPAIADLLNPGQVITVGESVLSNNRQYRLILQNDGNLVLYQEGVKALWATGTQGKPAALAAMQTDGNFVVYDANGQPLWHSGIQSQGAFLNVQDDGNLVIYKPPGIAIWASNTALGQVNPPPPPPPSPPSTITICASSPVPDGYIKVNDSWSPTSCGNPTSIIYNVWTLTRYADLSIGSSLSVCSSAPIPNGWVVVATRWSPTSCGRPSSNIKNITTIQRVL